MRIRKGTILQHEPSGNWYVVEHGGRYMIRTRNISRTPFDKKSPPTAWVSTWGIGRNTNETWSLVYEPK